jgi:N-acyl-D-aspartate/D-glutamate deacylase
MPQNLNHPQRNRHRRDGPAARLAHVAVDGACVTGVGALAGATATREAVATGLTLTPGFVHLHTHLDAQIGWDPFMTSSPWHGVTTVVMGNCGVTFAPAAAAKRGYPMDGNDFPKGKGRLLVKAEGYALTLVNGQVVTKHGARTGARPGRVSRVFAQT